MDEISDLQRSEEGAEDSQQPVEGPKAGTDLDDKQKREQAYSREWERVKQSILAETEDSPRRRHLVLFLQGQEELEAKRKALVQAYAEAQKDFQDNLKRMSKRIYDAARTIVDKLGRLEDDVLTTLRDNHDKRHDIMEAVSAQQKWLKEVSRQTLLSYAERTTNQPAMDQSMEDVEESTVAAGEGNKSDVDNSILEPDWDEIVKLDPTYKAVIDDFRQRRNDWHKKVEEFDTTMNTFNAETEERHKRMLERIQDAATKILSKMYEEQTQIEMLFMGNSRLRESLHASGVPTDFLDQQQRNPTSLVRLFGPPALQPDFSAPLIQHHGAPHVLVPLDAYIRCFTSLDRTIPLPRGAPGANQPNQPAHIVELSVSIVQHNGAHHALVPLETYRRFVDKNT